LEPSLFHRSSIRRKQFRGQPDRLIHSARIGRTAIRAKHRLARRFVTKVP
jgi:hypothetical protein